MDDKQEKVELTIKLDANTFAMIKALVPMLKIADLTPEILAAAYVEERIDSICQSIRSGNKEEA